MSKKINILTAFFVIASSLILANTIFVPAVDSRCVIADKAPVEKAPQVRGEVRVYNAIYIFPTKAKFICENGQVVTPQWNA